MIRDLFFFRTFHDKMFNLNGFLNVIIGKCVKIIINVFITCFRLYFTNSHLPPPSPWNVEISSVEPYQNYMKVSWNYHRNPQLLQERIDSQSGDKSHGIIANVLKITPEGDLRISLSNRELSPDKGRSQYILCCTQAVIL